MQTFQQMKQDESYCQEGRAFARRFTTLRAAWNACKDGCWMAYWLRFGRSIPMRDLVELGHEAGLVNGNIFSGCDNTRETIERYADVLRKAYTPTGIRRKRT